MRIGVDGREICGQPAGKGQYLLRVIRAWISKGDVEIVIYIRPGQVAPEDIIKATTVREVKGRGPLWHRAVAKRLHKDGATVFFAALSYQSALWNTVPTVTVVHDLAVFKVAGLAHNRRSQFVERLTLQRSMQRSVRVIAISESTKNDLIEQTKVPAEKITVTLLAPLLVKKPESPIPRAKREPVILFVGTLEPRKNISTVLRAYAGLPKNIRLVYGLELVGKKGWGGEDYPALAQELGIARRVHFRGYVTDDELYAFYRQSAVFVFPSLYEGFGLPPLEAMACGTPVITSNLSSLPEVVGEAGILVDPYDEKALTVGLERILTDSEYYTRISEQAAERARLFTWDKTATETLTVLRSV